MIRGNFKISLIITLDGTTVNDTLHKAAEISRYLEEHNIAIAFHTTESCIPNKVRVWIAEPPEQKIKAIKEVRDFLNISLKEAKDFVEGTPIHLSYTEAERFKAALAMCGLTVEY